MSSATPSSRAHTTRLLAIASGGGHWVQLRRMRPAWEGCRVTYVTTIADYAREIEPGAGFRVINDASRWDKIGLVRMLLRIAWIMLRTRPHVVISTGAAPGFFAIRLGRLLGARTIWVDSIANAEELSMTGKLVQRHADVWLTQWEHLSGSGGPAYAGAVL